MDLDLDERSHVSLIATDEMEEGYEHSIQIDCMGGVLEQPNKDPAAKASRFSASHGETSICSP